MRVRARVLRATFNLLYGPLASCHEPIGRLLFGRAWDARRRTLLERDAPGNVTLDLGCGEGRLLASQAGAADLRIGVEPSHVMAHRARRRGNIVIRGTAQCLPLEQESVGLVVCSYPGPWIFDPQTWQELARVTRSGAHVRILLGGTIERGPAARARSFILHVGYGRSDNADIPALGTPEITGAYERRADDWGEAVYWSGTRR